MQLTVNAVGGYNSYQIFDLFEESYDPSQSVIVFDAGTNDNPDYPQILAGNLAKVAATVGDRCMVVPTIHGLTVNGVDNTGKNRVVAEFAASRPGTQTPDWAGAVATPPGADAGRRPAPDRSGRRLRAQLIAQGVLGCLAYESGAPPRSVRGAPGLRPSRRTRRPMAPRPAAGGAGRGTRDPDDASCEVLATRGCAVARRCRSPPALAAASAGCGSHSASRPGRSGGPATPQLKSSAEALGGVAAGLGLGVEDARS